MIPMVTTNQKPIIDTQIQERNKQKYTTKENYRSTRKETKKKKKKNREELKEKTSWKTGYKMAIVQPINNYFKC